MENPGNFRSQNLLMRQAKPREMICRDGRTRFAQKMKRSCAKRKRTNSSFVSGDYYSDDSAVGSDMDVFTDDDDFFPSTTRSKKTKFSRGTKSVKEEVEMDTAGISVSKTGMCDTNGSGSNVVSKEGQRILMRQWLEQQADSEQIPGFHWYNKEKREIRIPWKHGSRSGWTIDDCRVYYAWAEHTGKVNHSPMQPKKWKANFRCALNSLPDVKELCHLFQKKGTDPFKVYVLLPETQRRRCLHARKIKKNLKINRVKEEKPIKEECVFESEDGFQLPQRISHPCSNELNLKDRIKVEPYNTDYDNCNQSFEYHAGHQPSALIPTVVEEISQDTYDDLIDLDSLSNETKEYDPSKDGDHSGGSPRSESSSTSSYDSGYLGNSLEDLQYYESSPEDLQLIERTLEEMEFSSCWEQTEDGKSLLSDSYYCNFDNSEFLEISSS